MAYTYEEVKDAVFHAHEKPEALADMVASALGVTVPERPANLVLKPKPSDKPEAPPEAEESGT